jgi:hypothetical protein
MGDFGMYMHHHIGVEQLYFQQESMPVTLFPTLWFCNQGALERNVDDGRIKLFPVDGNGRIELEGNS